MTKQQLREEILRCGRDPVYFIKKYYKIKHPQKGLIPFELFDFQEELIGKYLQNRFVVVLKSRQMGISEVTGAFAAWLMLFHRDKNILAVATKADVAKNIVKKVRTGLTKLPRWLPLARLDSDNKMGLELNNGSVIKAVASSSDAGRSEALSLLIIDEAAFIKNMDELWTSLLPTVSAGGRVIVISTPNGVGNIFHKVYTDAEAARNDFDYMKIPWWLHPERRVGLRDDPDRPGYKISEWYLKETRNMSSRDIAQELDCNFNSSGETVIGPDTLSWLETQVVSALKMENWDRKLFIWSEPQPNKSYFIVADVARGDGKDHSAFHVFDGDMNQEAEYYGQMPTDDFADLLCDTGRRYNTALLVVENNNVGLACLEHVKQNQYTNVFFSSKRDDKPGEAVDVRYSNFSSDLIIGLTTTQRTRPLMISKLEEFLRQRCVNFRSRRFLGELRSFVWINGRPEAAKGKNDDLVMAAALGCWVKDTFITPNFASLDSQRKMLSTISMNKVVNTDIKGASKDPRLVPSRSLGVFFAPKNQYQTRLPNGVIFDYSELLERPRRK